MEFCFTKLNFTLCYHMHCIHLVGYYGLITHFTIKCFWINRTMLRIELKFCQFNYDAAKAILLLPRSCFLKHVAPQH
uniref:Uncharacterized protein n=1 Tax=Arundo donax TaxID=35708 RepID=A0A0A9F355_ARUDO